MAIRPVQRIKHVVDNSSTVSQNVATVITLALATDTPVLAQEEQCITGSIINGFYIRMEVASNEAIDLGAIPNIYMYVWKNTGGNLTGPNPNNTGSSDNKKFIIHQEMSMIENKGQGSNARTLFNGVVVVPKGMRRMGPNDTWEIRFICVALATVVCVQSHWKEFR